MGSPLLFKPLFFLSNAKNNNDALDSVFDKRCFVVCMARIDGEYDYNT